MMKRLVALAFLVLAMTLGTAGTAYACFPDERIVFWIGSYAVDEATSTATEPDGE